MSEENELMEQEPMTESIDIASLYEQFKQAGNEVDEHLNCRIQAFIKQKNDLDTKTYVSLLYMEGMKYEAQDNKNGARYCALRIHEIRACYDNLKKKRPRNLLMDAYEFPEDMSDFVIRYTDFLDEVYHKINKRLFTLTIILFLIVVFALIFFLRIHIVFALIEALLLGMLNFVIQKRKMPAIFMKNQLQAIEHNVEEDVLEFDRPIRFS